MSKLRVRLNEEKTKKVDLKTKGIFSFLGFNFSSYKTRKGKVGILKIPTIKARTTLLKKLKEQFRKYLSQSTSRVISIINPILRGWTNYFRIGNSSGCFGYVKDWVEKQVRGHLMKSRQLKGLGWARWSKETIYDKMGLYKDYQIRYYSPESNPTDRP